MQKKWNVLPRADREFLNKFSEYPEIVLQLLFHRGLRDKSEIEAFLDPDYEKNILDPFLFSKMGEAVDLIIKHVKQKDKIFVYGDYDADGITATAILYETLKTLKADAEAYIPFRITEGYGLNENAIKHIVGHGTKLIITVDTGIRNKKQVEYAKEHGIDVIITDHHLPPPDVADYPDCLIIDPHTAGETYPFKSLAGCGIAFKLAKALIGKTKLDQEHKILLEERVLDLAAIGTVADIVSLLGENRVIVKKGLEKINSTKRVGLKELIKVSQVNAVKEMDSWNIGFQIAPRLNAAGRLEHANTSFELLVTKDREEAAKLAESLNRNNARRQQITDEIVLEIESVLDGKPIKDIIVAVSPSFDPKQKWNEGVIGLVASRITEKYYRPSIVITSGDHLIKGSGRSIEEFNLIKAVEECKDLLLKFGGHPAACGVQLKEKNLPAFKEQIERIAEERLKGVELAPKINIDAEIDLAAANEELLSEIIKFAPFGKDNEQPKFLSKNILVADIMTMGSENQHIKFRLKSEDSGLKTALAFGKAENYAETRIGDKIDIVYHLEMNNYNGRREVQLKLIDLKKSDKK